MEYTDYYKAFCKRMSIDRKMKNYDQSAMAERVGMTTPEYSNRESGRSMVSGTDLKKLWDSGADIDKLLVDVDEKPCRHVISSEIVKDIQLLRAVDKDSTKDSMLKCIRDVNDITDQQVISDNLGISRYKYSKIENNKEFPDAMVLIRLYQQYGCLPSMFLNLYDVRDRLLDYIFDSMSEKDQEIILSFISNLRKFV